MNLDLAAVGAAFVCAALLGLGVGTLNCVLFGFFPTWSNIWKVLTRPLVHRLGHLLHLRERAAGLPGGAVVEPARACGRR